MTQFDLWWRAASVPAGQVMDSGGSMSGVPAISVRAAAIGLVLAGVGTVAPANRAGASHSIIEYDTYEVVESIGELTIDLGVTATGRYETSDVSGSGAATAGADYVSVSGTVSGGGQVTVPIIDDAEAEPSETFAISFLVCTDGVCSVEDSATVKIVDDDQPTDSALLFTAASATVRESAGSVGVTVERVGATDAPARVRLHDIPGSADNDPTSGSQDYWAVDEWLEFAPGETAKLVTVAIVDGDPGSDLWAEPDETFALELAEPFGASLGSPARVDITIEDDQVVDWNVGLASDARRHVRTGDPLTYQVAVGQSPGAYVVATSARLAFELPAGTAFVSAALDASSPLDEPSTCTIPSQGTTGTVVCDLNNVIGTSTLTVQAVVTAPRRTTLTAIGTVEPRQNDVDPVSGNNSATLTVPVR